MNSSQRHTNKSSTELWLHKSCSTGRMFFATELLKSESLRVENLTEEKSFFFFKENLWEFRMENDDSLCM